MYHHTSSLKRSYPPLSARAAAEHTANASCDVIRETESRESRSHSSAATSEGVTPRHRKRQVYCASGNIPLSKLGPSLTSEVHPARFERCVQRRTSIQCNAADRSTSRGAPVREGLCQTLGKRRA